MRTRRRSPWTSSCVLFTLGLISVTHHVHTLTQHKIWTGVFIAAGSFKGADAFKYAEEHPNTVIAFGRLFIPNPDLPVRLQKGIALTNYNRDTFYLQGEWHTEGYTDYPAAS